jgi:hypothetical protein
MMWTYLLIVLVIAIALAPLSHFIPSKRQREIARMREYAAVHGMFVEFRGVPGRDRERAQERDRAGSETIYYGMRLPPARKKGEKALAWRRENEGWVALERRIPIPPALSRLPSQVLAASVDDGSCGVYWREAGSVEEVEQIRQALGLWAGELRGPNPDLA